MPSPSLALLALTLAADAGTWETVATGVITIKTRTIQGSPIREVLAEAELAASAVDVQRAIVDVERFPHFMPYVKEARLVRKTARDGTRIVYTSLGFPIVAGRDFVISDRVEKSLNPDGTGEFVTRWQVAEDLVPRQAGVVRLRTNSGSWRVTAKGAKTQVLYQFAVDPGGAIPPFLADLGNRTGVSDVFRAIEREAQRLATQPKAPALAGSPAPDAPRP